MTAISPKDIGLTVPQQGSTIIFGTAVLGVAWAARKLRSGNTKATKTEQ